MCWQIIKSKLLAIIFLSSMLFACSNKSPIIPNEIPSQMPQADIPWPSLANAPWPMYLHDPQHTGRSPYRGPQLGDLEWSANPAQQHELNTGIAVGPDSTLYFFSSAHLVALNLDGSEKWLFKFSDDVFGWPAETTPLIGANGTIYVTSLDKFLYAIRPDGTLGQKAFIDVFINDLALDFEGTLYGVGDDRHLYAIDKSGSILWNLFLDTGFFSNLPCLFSGRFDTLCFGMGFCTLCHLSFGNTSMDEQSRGAILQKGPSG